MTDLFIKKDFISHAGIPMKWKLECDGISEAEWQAPVPHDYGLSDRTFGKVIGIPRGGVPSQKALEPICYR